MRIEIIKYHGNLNHTAFGMYQISELIINGIDYTAIIDRGAHFTNGNLKHYLAKVFRIRFDEIELVDLTL